MAQYNGRNRKKIDDKTQRQNERASRHEDPCENPFAGFDLPPCARFLNNYNPMVNAEGQCIFINYNRVYCFVSLFCQQGKENPFIKNNLAPFACQSTINYQISFANFLLAVLIHQIQLGEVKKTKDMVFHQDKVMNDMINSLLDDTPKIDCDCVPSITLYCSNSNAVSPLYTVTTNISPINFYIILLLALQEQDAGLYLGNNAYVSPDPINYHLSSLYFPCPDPSYAHCGMSCDFCGNPWSKDKGERKAKTCHKRNENGQSKRGSRKKKEKSEENF